MPITSATTHDGIKTEVSLLHVQARVCPSGPRYGLLRDTLLYFCPILAMYINIQTCI